MSLASFKPLFIIFLENKGTQQAVAQKKQSFDITVTAPRAEIPLKAGPASLSGRNIFGVEYY